MLLYKKPKLGIRREDAISSIDGLPKPLASSIHQYPSVIKF